MASLAVATTKHFTVRYRAASIMERDLARILTRLEKAWDGTLRALQISEPPLDSIAVVLDARVLSMDEGEILWKDEHATEGNRRTITASYRADFPANGLERAVVKRIIAAALGENAARATAIIDGVTGHVVRDVADSHLVARWTDDAHPLSLPEILDGLDRDEPRSLYFRSAASFVSWLIVTQGPARFREFARQLDPKDPEPACRAVYKKSVHDLEIAWREAIGEKKQDGDALGAVQLGRMLFNLLRPYTGPCALVFAGMLVELAFTSAMPLGFRALIDTAIVPHDTTLLAKILVALVALGLMAAIAGVGRDYVYAKVSARVLADLRLKMFARLNELSTSYFVKSSAGDAVSRFTADAGTVEGAVGTGLLFALEWRLALVVVVAMPLGIIAPRVFARRAATASYKRKNHEGRAAAAVQEAFSTHAVIKTYHLGDLVTGRFKKLLDEVLKSSVELGLAAALVERSAEIALLLIELAVVTTGAVLAFQGTLSVGSLVAFHALYKNLADYATQLVWAVPSFVQASGGLRRIDELLSHPDAVVESPSAEPLDRLANRIALDDVTFSYTGGRPNLDRVSLGIAKGESVALVGASGSGKSTVLNLVMRFYDPSNGKVTFDGKDLRSASRESLYAQTAAVFQETVLFDTTILDNIKMGKLDATKEEIVAAAKAAEIHDVIEAMPQGYDTPVGERGGRLSGGQRQRIAIARAILRDPAILLLDEATSALDPETESQINETLARLGKERTVVSVTHRLASCASADRIVVFDRGQVLEEGAHEALLDKKGAYYNLWMKQRSFSGDGDLGSLDPERLRAIDALADLPIEALKDVAASLVTEVFPAGRTIFVARDPADKLYLIVRGAVEILARGEAGVDRVLTTLDDGDYFGEIVMVGGERRATARTKQPTLFWTLHREQIARIAKTHAAVVAAFSELPS
jgi:ATP-binding cassette subfamily B protein